MINKHLFGSYSSPHLPQVHLPPFFPFLNSSWHFPSTLPLVRSAFLLESFHTLTLFAFASLSCLTASCVSFRGNFGLICFSFLFARVSSNSFSMVYICLTDSLASLGFRTVCCRCRLISNSFLAEYAFLRFWSKAGVTLRNRLVIILTHLTKP